jgi:uroporphyrin-III C-methyltransferase / precorrin-2 dehydrogenase / sirohydrochlorin ferrochelatase
MPQPAPEPPDLRPARLEPLSRLPVFLALDGRRAVLVGGSEAAAWKAELLLATGAVLDIYSDEPCEALLAIIVQSPQARLNRRKWQADDLAGAGIAIGAFSDENEAIAFACVARGKGVPLNVVDTPLLCDFSFGSIVNRSPLIVAISTDGAAPTLAQALRTRIEALVPEGFQAWAKAAKAWRPLIKQAAGTMAARRRLWQIFAQMAFAKAHQVPTEADLAVILAQRDQAEGLAQRGTVEVFTINPTDPDALTLGMVKALQAADMVWHQLAITPAILAFARREAVTGLLPAGQEGQALIQDCAAQGKHVVVLLEQAQMR